jgi:hypothetical protein
MAGDAEILARAVAQLVRDHHEAFLVELLGHTVSGATPQFVQQLLESGMVDAGALGGVDVGGVDPYTFVRAVAELANAADPATRHKMRSWTLQQWLPRVAGWKEAQSVSGAQASFPLASYTVGTPPSPSSISAGAAPIQAPDWLRGPKVGAWQQAVSRAGDYARGLGNEAAGKLEDRLTEAWAGEDILAEVDAQKREQTLQIIREKTAEAISTHLDAGQLARDLADATENWAHNWDRVAKTELQGAYNEGVILDAAEAYGGEAQIARIPESNACADCLRLFLDGDGLPIIWTVGEIVGNGTNVGRHKNAWVATAWPVHPNCQCDTITVPPGFYVLRGGQLRPRRKAA